MTFILYRAALKILEFLTEEVKNLDPNLSLNLSTGATIPSNMSILTVNVRSLKNIDMIWKHLFIVLSLGQM